MAATRTAIVSRLHETWAEAVPQNGGAAQTFSTTLPYAGAADANFVDSILTLVAVVGAPVMVVAYAASATQTLDITVSNTAAGGNTATWNLDVHLQHTIIR